MRITRPPSLDIADLLGVRVLMSSMVTPAAAEMIVQPAGDRAGGRAFGRDRLINSFAIGHVTTAALRCVHGFGKRIVAPEVTAVRERGSQSIRESLRTSTSAVGSQTTCAAAYAMRERNG